jgi:hypothetical protein
MKTDHNGDFVDELADYCAPRVHPIAKDQVVLPTILPNPRLEAQPSQTLSDQRVFRRDFHECFWERIESA